jgi:hypothetical protein
MMRLDLGCDVKKFQILKYLGIGSFRCENTETVLSFFILEFVNCTAV